MLEIITVANLRQGGKSTIARLLAERLNSNILNFDSNRNAEYYNAIETFNIPLDKKIRRNENSLILYDNKEEIEITSNGNSLICDMGGHYDNRVTSIKSDYYIIPCVDDFESISEGMRAATLIRNDIPKANILFVLNGSFIRRKDIKEEKEIEFKEAMKTNNFEEYPYLYLAYSDLMRKLVDYGVKQKDIKGKHGQDINYISVEKFIDEVLKILKLKDNR